MEMQLCSLHAVHTTRQTKIFKNGDCQNYVCLQIKYSTIAVKSQEIFVALKEM